MPTISDRIKEAMEIKNLKQSDLVERTGISKGALSSYIAGRYAPKQNNIYLIAKALNVSESWLMGLDVPMKRQSSIKNNSTGIKINVLGRVAAGIPIDAIEEIIDTEEITAEMAASGSYFGLQIKGHSMEPRICDGDVVIVRQQDDVESGEIAIVIVNGNDGTCKRVKKYADTLMLLPINPTYDPIVYSKEDVEKLPVRIIGKVVELRGKL